ncbi:hypothetical protein, partial [Bacillus cereus]|uniref:hypothetical protein n=1 Tax=Bacillus cereus TaxID=1396 RepID=UPI0034D45E56
MAVIVGTLLGSLANPKSFFVILPPRITTCNAAAEAINGISGSSALAVEIAALAIVIIRST